MKNILSRFIEGQTHFGMPRGAKLSLTLNEPKLVALGSTSNTNSKHAPQSGSNLLTWYAKQPMANHRVFESPIAKLI